MSRENVEIVRANLEAWNAGDMDAVRQSLATDVIVKMPDDWPEPGPYVGRDSAMRQADQMREPWDADSVKLIGDFIDFADHVLVRFTWRTAGRGPALNTDVTMVYTLRRRSIFLVEYFWDHTEALEAVGLSEHKTLAAPSSSPPSPDA